MLPTLLLLLLTPTALLAAPDSQPTIVAPTLAAPSATSPSSPGHGYVFAGCYNETTSVPGTNGARALSGGNTSANNSMTIGACIAFCASARPDNRYAGLEYGRECYCAPVLSAFSTKLDPSKCAYACDGNASEVCGGSLALSLYNKTESAAGRVMAGWVGGEGRWWVGWGVLGLVVLGVVV